MLFEEIQRLLGETSIRFAEPITDISTNTANRWFALYLLSATLFAGLILYFRLRKQGASFSSALKELPSAVFDRKILMHRSALLDYRYALINHAVKAAVLIYLIAAVNALTGVFRDFFVMILPAVEGSVETNWFGAAMIIFIFAFAYDTHNFFQHYLQHKVPILWEFHKVHHSAEVLTPVTVVRVHPVSQLLSATVAAFVYGALNGFGFAFFAGDLAAYSLIGANVFALLFYTVGLYHLKHSHVWVTFPPVIREIFASPSLHLIHHSTDPKHFDKNLGFVFTFWDRVMGTFYAPDESEQYGLELGISESEGRDDYNTVAGLYLTPFKRVWRYHIKPLLPANRNQDESVEN